MLSSVCILSSVTPVSGLLIRCSLRVCSAAKCWPFLNCLLLELKSLFFFSDLISECVFNIQLKPHLAQMNVLIASVQVSGITVRPLSSEAAPCYYLAQEHCGCKNSHRAPEQNSFTLRPLSTQSRNTILLHYVKLVVGEKNIQDLYEAGYCLLIC